MTEPSRPVSALPSAKARAVALGAIIFAGLCGALIGWSIVDLQCAGSCGLAEGVATVVGGAGAAGGVAVIAVLTLRAMGEWNAVTDRQLEGGDDADPTA